MRRFFRKYLPFTRGEIEGFVEYRAQAIVWFILEIIGLTLQFFIWKAIFNNSVNETIRGFDFKTMVTYIFMIRIVFSLTFVNPSEYMSNDIRTGAIAMQLIKPINYRTQLFFKALGVSAISFMFFVLPMLVIMGITSIFVDFYFDITLLNMLFFILSNILALLIRFHIGFLFGSIIFLTINNFGIYQLREAIESVFSGQIIPISFFPPFLLSIAMFLPFMQTLYVPVQIFLNAYETTNDVINALLFQLLWVVILIILSHLAWKIVTKRIVVQGG